MKYQQLLLGALYIFGVALSGLGLQGCQFEEPTSEGEQPLSSPTGESTPAPNRHAQETSPNPADDRASERPTGAYQPVWELFPGPGSDPATPIPPPLKDLSITEEVLVWVLLGSDTEPPFIGRTKAIHLLFIHPRFSRASLVSIPGDLYVYIPGHSMQRLNTAYALGGIETLRLTFEYNFGVRPSRFVLAHPGDLQWLVDDISSIEVTVFYPMPQACGGIQAGLVRMDGAMALCYASHRDGMDEIDRMRRQQQLLRSIFRKLTRDGNLVQLPTLYASFQGWVKTDISLMELMGYIPMALKLADPGRIGYYMLGWDQITLWEVPGYSQAQVFLPIRDSVKNVLQQAIDDVMTPKPLTDQVKTLEAQLTAAHQLTPSLDVTGTPTLTPTPMMEATVTPTPTITPPGYP